MDSSVKIPYDRSLTLSNTLFGNDLRRVVPGIFSRVWKAISTRVNGESTLESPAKEILVTLSRYVYMDTVHVDEPQGRDNNNVPQDKYAVTLPPDWNELTTAVNDDPDNGYCGVAFVNYSTRQIVIAHRGLYYHAGSLQNCIDGVITSKYAPQVSSAVTFVDMIRKELCKLREENIIFNLTFTGHSFGGWLAQITGLTVMRLYLSSRTEFILAHPRDTLEAEIRVFDSPGCYDMIKKLCNDFDFNASTLIAFGKRVLNYTLGPNVINLFGHQIGKQIEIIVAHYSQKIRGSHSIKMIEKAILDINSIIREAPRRYALVCLVNVTKLVLKTMCHLLNVLIDIRRFFSALFLSVVERGLTFIVDLGYYLLSFFSGNLPSVPPQPAITAH